MAAPAAAIGEVFPVSRIAPLTKACCRDGSNDLAKAVQF